MSQSEGSVGRRFELPTDEIQTIRGAVEDIFDEIDGLTEAEAFDLHAKVGADLRPDLPVLDEVLEEFSTHRSWGAIIVRLAEPDDAEIGSTPTSYLSPEQNPWLKHDGHRAILLGVAQWYGYGYTSQQPRNIHNNVIAIPEYADANGISASLRPLKKHTEDASYDPFSPDFLTLDFLRNPDDVGTTLSMPDFYTLSPAAQETLSRPFLVNRTNPGQGGSANDNLRAVAPFYGDTEHPWIRLNTATLDLSECDAREIMALIELAEVMKSQEVVIPPTPGDLLLIDNRRVLHGREGYSEDRLPKFDGTDRWQRRVVATQDPELLQQVEVEPRIVDPQLIFAVGSGAIEHAVAGVR